jgi:hypothetical protein
VFQPSSSAKASAVILTHGISPFTLFSGKFLPIRIRKKIAYSIRIGELPISNGIDEFGIDNDIDSDLRVILRKLTKKDSTTKIRVKPNRFFERNNSIVFSFSSSKAFNELRDYCDANESDEKIRGILPFFVSHYRKWSTVRYESNDFHLIFSRS